MTQATTDPTPAAAPRRSLILAGGGMRVAYQAGVIRALFEAGLTFSHADGTSGGLMNLAMLLSGLTPEEMCTRWRTLDPRQFSAFLPPLDYLRPGELPALGSANGVRNQVFPHLGIDIDRIHAATNMVGTFNVGNFSRKTSEVFTHDQVDVDLLIAGLSLPIFLPPVPRNGSLYLDAVWIRDANLMEAVRRGADELWVVWCIGNSPAYHGGAFNQYVHMIELSANGALFGELEQIADINARIARGETVLGHSRPIVLHLVKPPVPLPLDPDYFTDRIDAATLIDHGYADARQYLAEMRPAGLPLDPSVTAMAEPAPGIAFRETMLGGFVLGESDPVSGERAGNAAQSILALHCAIDIRDVARFVADATHAGDMVAHLSFPPLGEDLLAQRGVFNLFFAPDDPRRKLMVYEVGFRAGGQEYYLAGRKEVLAASVTDLWPATTTLYTQLHQGPDKSGPVVGAGVLHIAPMALVQLSASMHATSTPTPEAAAVALSTFGRFFMAELWDTYFARQHALPSTSGVPALARNLLDRVRAVSRRMVTQRSARAGSLLFTEDMRGYVSFDEADFMRGYADGKASGTSLSFELTITMPDMARFVADPHHEAPITGVIVCEALGGSLPVERGIFNLFVAGSGVRTRLMLYRLFFRDGAGHLLTLTGFKTLQADAPLATDMWHDTTTLFTRVVRGHVMADQEGGAPLVGSGVLHLSVPDFLKELTTFRAGGAGLGDEAGAAAGFGMLWLNELWEVYSPAMT